MAGIVTALTASAMTARYVTTMKNPKVLSSFQPQPHQLTQPGACPGLMEHLKAPRRYPGFERDVTARGVWSAARMSAGTATRCRRVVLRSSSSSKSSYPACSLHR
ncbi:hypothetical protein ACVME8_008833 [Bradyrhizobium diazoefficiens]